MNEIFELFIIIFLQLSMSKILSCLYNFNKVNKVNKFIVSCLRQLAENFRKRKD